MTTTELEAAIQRFVRDVEEVMSRYDMNELRELMALIESASRPSRQLLHNGKKPR